jgi:hypothetical protein
MEPSMNAFVRPAHHVFAPIDEIEVPAPLLAYDAARTVELAKAIRSGKTIDPLAVVKKRGRYILVEGKDELAALRLVDAETAPVRLVADITLTWRQRRLLARKPQ